MKQHLKKRIFLDYASATPVLDEVQKAMNPFFAAQFENPSALYAEAVEVRRVVQESRKAIANVLKAHNDEIVFTGSGTEADNLAIFGVAGPLTLKRPHIILSPFEHSAIRKAAQVFIDRGGSVSLLPVYHDGRVRADDVKKLITRRTVLVSVMYANNEIGTIQPVKDIAKVIRHYNKANSCRILFHTDASQAANYLSLNVLELGVDLMTLDASKVYGPKGIGLLFVKRGIELSPQIVGGGQEAKRRSGTENVPGIVGFAAALILVQSDRGQESKRLCALRDFALDSIVKTFPHSQVNGSRVERLPNNINVCIKGIDAEFTTLKLDARGFAVSTSSSCEAQSDDPRSIAVDSLGDLGCAVSSLRITIGRPTTKNDVVSFIAALKKVLT